MSQEREYEVCTEAPASADEFAIGAKLELLKSPVVVVKNDFPGMIVSPHRRDRRCINPSIRGLVDTINGQLFYIKSIAGRRIYLLHVKELEGANSVEAPNAE